MSEQLKAKLTKLAARKCWSDNPNFSTPDCFGGNLDDAYEGGVSDGEILLAREILQDLATSEGK